MLLKMNYLINFIVTNQQCDFGKSKNKLCRVIVGETCEINSLMNRKGNFR